MLLHPVVKLVFGFAFRPGQKAKLAIVRINFDSMHREADILRAANST